MTGKSVFQHFKPKGRVPVGKSKTTWDEVLRKDIESKGLATCHQVTKTDPSNMEYGFQDDDILISVYLLAGSLHYNYTEK